VARSKNQLIESTNLNDPARFGSNWSCSDGLDQGVATSRNSGSPAEPVTPASNLVSAARRTAAGRHGPAQPPWNAAMPETKAMHAEVKATVQGNPS
jgi:hypothetical protein